MQHLQFSIGGLRRHLSNKSTRLKIHSEIPSVPTIECVNQTNFIQQTREERLSTMREAEAKALAESRQQALTRRLKWALHVAAQVAASRKQNSENPQTKSFSLTTIESDWIPSSCAKYHPRGTRANSTPCLFIAGAFLLWKVYLLLEEKNCRSIGNLKTKAEFFASRLRPCVSPYFCCRAQL